MRKLNLKLLEAQMIELKREAIRAIVFGIVGIVVSALMVFVLTPYFSEFALLKAIFSSFGKCIALFSLVVTLLGCYVLRFYKK